MDIAKETVSELLHGHVVVGATRSQLSTIPFGAQKGILLRAPGAQDPSANTACVWVGGARVTADSTPATGGIPIPPGSALFVPIDDLSRLWVVSTAAAQDLAWMML